MTTLRLSTYCRGSSGRHTEAPGGNRIIIATCGQHFFRATTRTSHTELRLSYSGRAPGGDSSGFATVINDAFVCKHTCLDDVEPSRGGGRAGRGTVDPSTSRPLLLDTQQVFSIGVAVGNAVVPTNGQRHRISQTRGKDNVRTLPSTHLEIPFPVAVFLSKVFPRALRQNRRRARCHPPSSSKRGCGR